MNINPRRPVSLLLVALACVAIVISQQGGAKPQPLRMIHYHGDMAGLLATFAEDYGVIIGLEADPGKPKPEVTIDLRDATLRDILNGIVESEPRYQWRESGEYIEVFPTSGSSILLDTPVASFQVKDVRRGEAINQLMSLPEVQALMISMNLKLRPAGPSPTWAKDEKFSLNLNGVTLRQAMQRIVKESGARFWMFRTHDDGSFSIGTDYR